MTHIQPIQFLRNGPFANSYSTIINFDDCKSFATFQATFFNKDSQQVWQETVPLNGADYDKWDGNNEFPAVWVASVLNLTIIDNEPEPSI
jgi:hypothetical protein